MMEVLKGEIMEVLKNFVTEKTPESENASHEIHDEDTRKVNQEWRMLVLLHMKYDRYSMYYYNNECSIYREHKVTIHERMRPLNNQ
jgi:hypothetical protein